MEEYWQSSMAAVACLEYASATPIRSV